MSLLLNPPLQRVPRSLSLDEEARLYLDGLNTQFEQIYRFLRAGNVQIDANDNAAASAFLANTISQQSLVNEEFRQLFSGLQDEISSLEGVVLGLQNSVSILSSQVDQLSLDVDVLETSVGSLSSLDTVDKSSIVAALNETFNSIPPPS